MKRMKIPVFISTALLAAAGLFLFSGCGAEPGLAEVSSVDQLLSAIGPNRTIQLAPGAYELSQASDYGQVSDSPYYTWREENGGYTLILRGVENLTIQGDKDCRITMVKPTPDILVVENSRGVTLENLSLSHAGEIDSQSSGGVRLENCEDVALRQVNLHRSGAYGLRIKLSGNVQVTDSSLYDCALVGVIAEGSRDILVENCRMYALGGTPQEGISAFYLWLTDNVTITGCTLSDSALESLLVSAPCDGTQMTDCAMENVRFSESAFRLYGSSLVFDGNSFSESKIRTWYAGSQGAVDLQGNVLTEAQLDALLAPGETGPDGERQSISVATVDEFLAAIGPNREIILEGELFDLSTAQGYGEDSGAYYYWDQIHDGPGLIISGAENLTIRSADGDPSGCTISATPRYADVLTFLHCDGLVLSGFTAGHTKEPGICAGGVLKFRDCDGIQIQRCGLFGCGILGIHALDCSGLDLVESEIYECSQGGLMLDSVTGVSIQGCIFRDLGGDRLMMTNCEEVTLDGEPLDGNAQIS